MTTCEVPESPKGESPCQKVHLIFHYQGKKRDFVLTKTQDIREGDLIVYDNTSDPELISGNRDVETAEVVDISVTSGRFYLTVKTYKGGVPETFGLLPSKGTEAVHYVESRLDPMSSPLSHYSQRKVK